MRDLLVALAQECFGDFVQGLAVDVAGADDSIAVEDVDHRNGLDVVTREDWAWLGRVAVEPVGPGNLFFLDYCPSCGDGAVKIDAEDGEGLAGEALARAIS